MGYGGVMVTSGTSKMAERASAFFKTLQDSISQGVERSDGRARFVEDLWEREGGGGGRTRVMEGGRAIEKGGVNFSAVHGELPEEFARKVGGEGRDFFATGVSLVLHPNNPFCPTVHANFRYFEQGSVRWFGGGADLTPSYLFVEDARHFHATFKRACDAHNPEHYPRFKEWCDRYFFLRHRNETRGVGGIFFDHLGRDGGDFEAIFRFVQDAGHAFLPAYLPLVERRANLAYTPQHRRHQLLRRGRYVEFNLVYDRGTIFGLETNGRVESILMSLPPLARWGYAYEPAPGTAERRMADHLKAVDWLKERGSP